MSLTNWLYTVGFLSLRYPSLGEDIEIRSDLYFCSSKIMTLLVLSETKRHSEMDCYQSKHHQPVMGTSSRNEAWEREAFLSVAHDP